MNNSGSPTISSINGTNISILPNKSALYGNHNNNNNVNNNINSKHNNHVNTNTITVKMTSSSSSSSSSTSSLSATTNKVVPNHGKPNCAPKPPGIQNIAGGAKNGLSPTTTTTATTNNGHGSGNSIGRPIVSRAHSMRSPRFVLHRFFYFTHSLTKNSSVT